MFGLRILKYVLPVIGLVAGIGYCLMSNSIANETVPPKATPVIHISDAQDIVQPKAKAMSLIRISKLNDCGNGFSCKDGLCCGTPLIGCCPSNTPFYCKDTGKCYQYSTQAEAACSNNYGICYSLVK